MIWFTNILKMWRKFMALRDSKCSGRLPAAGFLWRWKMDIIKISLLGVCGVILGFLMKGTKPEYACFITVGIGLVIMGLAVGKIYYLFESLGKIQETLPVDTEYISTLVKMIGITYIGQFASGICKDAGYSTTAAQIELFCKLSVMVLSMPVLMALLKTIQEFMV